MQLSVIIRPSAETNVWELLEVSLRKEFNLALPFLSPVVWDRAMMAGASGPISDHKAKDHTWNGKSELGGAEPWTCQARLGRPSWGLLSRECIEATIC